MTVNLKAFDQISMNVLSNAVIKSQLHKRKEKKWSWARFPLKLMSIVRGKPQELKIENHAFGMCALFYIFFLSLFFLLFRTMLMSTKQSQKSIFPDEFLFNLDEDKRNGCIFMNK